MRLQFQFVLLLLIGWINRHNQDLIEYLKAENRVLRELLGEKRLRLTNAQRALLARKGKVLGRKRLGEVATLAKADTILRWHRQLGAKKKGSAKRRGPGRPRISLAIVDLVVRVALENPSFGYTRIRDVLANLGLCVSRSSVARILKAQGILPAPERRKHMSWRTFLAAQLDSLWGEASAECGLVDGSRDNEPAFVCLTQSHYATLQSEESRARREVFCRAWAGRPLVRPRLEAA